MLESKPGSNFANGEDIFDHIEMGVTTPSYHPLRESIARWMLHHPVQSLVGASAATGLVDVVVALKNGSENIPLGAFVIPMVLAVAAGVAGVYQAMIRQNQQLH